MMRQNIEHGFNGEGLFTENETGEMLLRHYPHRRNLEKVMDDLTEFEEKEIKYGEENEESDNYKMIVTKKGSEEICVGTDRYNLIQNEEVVQPIVDCIENMNLRVVGEVRDYKNSLSIDIYPVNNQELFKELEDVDGRFSIGLEYRLSHDKTSSIKVRPFICHYTGTKTNLMRVGNWSKIRHYKPEDQESKKIYDGMYTMTSESLFEMGFLANQFVDKVTKAYNTTVDLNEEGYTLGEIYREWLHENTPEKVIEKAVETAVERESDSRTDNNEYSMWSIVSGFTYALTSVSSMKDGNNKDRHYKKAKNALEFPEKILEDILSGLEEEEDDNQITLEQVSQTEKELRELRE